MAHKLLYLFCLLLMGVSVARGQVVERVSPVLGSDEQANQLILYIAENLKLIIPANRDLKSVNGQMRCKLTIDPSGRTSNIDITRSSVMWLDLIIADGLKVIPPWFGWRGQDKYKLSKELVFSFGQVRRSGALYGYNKSGVNEKIGRSMDLQRKELKAKLDAHWNAWDKKTRENLKLDMPLTPDNRQPMTKMPNQKNPILPLDVPPIHVSLE
ncbi:MAG: hypothetical protein RR329_07340 [Mucinivorans sp.]